MTQRERLIELILNSGVIEQFFDYEMQEAERLADYLLKNGVIVLPCKVGDTVYTVYNFWNGTTILEEEVKSISINEIVDSNPIRTTIDISAAYNLDADPDCEWTFCEDEIGRKKDRKGRPKYRSVFLTREAAEKALKERGE